MLKVLLVSLIFSSNICLGQLEFDSLVFNHLDSVWKATPIPSYPVLSLDSNQS